MKKENTRSLIRYILFLLAGILIGWLMFRNQRAASGSHEQTSEISQDVVWTCSMHPHIRMSQPGKCPICGMDLIRLGQQINSGDPNDVHMTEEAVQLANVLTEAVKMQHPVKEVRLYGKIKTDERLIYNQTVHISGRIEKLFVSVTGEVVKKGQPLALLYSPELITAQEELLQAAARKESLPGIYEAARERLSQWKLTDNQIAFIEQTGKVVENVEVMSDVEGVVISRKASSGDYVERGTVIFEIADLSSVWVLFEAYEDDLSLLQKGDTVSFTVHAIPGHEFSGRISFIDPVIDPASRTARVRIEIPNPAGTLKPEMFASGIVKGGLDGGRKMIVIPASAVMWTGKRSVVYVRQPGNEEYVYRMRIVTLGSRLGNAYLVKEGLEEGEELVVSGAFSVDATAQLEGKASMMNPE